MSTPLPDRPAAPRGARIDVTGRELTASFVSTLFVQAAWNYRSMLGAGIAFSLLPVLRAVYADDREGLERALARHSEHFNAHPYLANLAVGAVARLELEGAAPELQRRFKQALRSPLGGLGDSLVWAGWLPLCALVGLALGGLGAPGWIAVLTFLVLYNAGHLALRFWGFRLGLRRGSGVGAGLREADLGRRTEEVTRAGSLLLGVVLGVVLTHGASLMSSLGGIAAGAWAAVAVVVLVLGLLGGHTVWRPVALVVVAAVGVTVLVGSFLT